MGTWVGTSPMKIRLSMELTETPIVNGQLSLYIWELFFPPIQHTYSSVLILNRKNEHLTYLKIWKKNSSHYVPLTEVFAFNTCLISRNLIFFSLIAHFLTALAYNNDKSLFRGRNAKIGYFISNTNLSQALKWCKAKSTRPMLKILQHHTVLFCESTQAVSVVVLVPKGKEMLNCGKNNRASGKHEWEGVDSLGDREPGRLLRHPSPFISD